MSIDMDARLREYAQRWRDGQPEPRDVDELAPIPEQPRRPRTKTLIAVGVSAAAVALLAVGLVVANRNPRAHAPAALPPTGSHAAHVPWNAVTVHPDTAVYHAAAKVGAPADLRRCTDDDFAVESGRTRTAADDGWLTTAFVLKSTASTPCSVSNGWVDVELLTATGAALPIDGIPAGGPAVFPSTLLVKPGQLVSGAAHWAVYLGRAPRPTRLIINPDGRVDVSGVALSVSLIGVKIPPHPRDPSNIGPWRSTSYGYIDQVADPGTLASLTATITAPTTVRVGDTIRYSVTLANLTATAVSIAPCPDFAQRLDVVPSKFATTVGSRGALNCPQAPKMISPHRSATFDYELDTAGEIAGPGSLTWQLLDGPSAAVTATSRLSAKS